MNIAKRRLESRKIESGAGNPLEQWGLAKIRNDIKNSKELKENDPLRGHACRAVDYYNDFEFPMKGTSKTEIRQHFN